MGMKQWARCLGNPDQPDDGEVIEIAEAERMEDIVWTVPDIVTWLTVEITDQMSVPAIGAHYDGKTFAAPKEEPT
jgi:hypothetical protein